ncbi:hypothetical protein FJT64_015469 [Amphibalanus amphitrite]|uniref:Uncharacterized protein n=1 Tax=Amphibalanus amphitrite TaxID=1232801 RepID=A0A6A4XCH8_AMPAM|nr:hypothetical protein FJT64_015469 [Amphibalanus amphitrite]
MNAKLVLVVLAALVALATASGPYPRYGYRHYGYGHPGYGYPHARYGRSLRYHGYPGYHGYGYGYSSAHVHSYGPGYGYGYGYHG